MQVGAPVKVQPSQRHDPTVLCNRCRLSTALGGHGRETDQDLGGCEENGRDDCSRSVSTFTGMVVSG